MAVRALLESNFAAAAELFHARATEAESGAAKASCLANAAAAEHAIELNRRCLKTCDAAIAAHGNCLSAFLTQGMAYAAVGKPAKAKAAWKAGIAVAAAVDASSPHADAHVVLALQRLVEGGPSLANALPPQPAATALTAAADPCNTPVLAWAPDGTLNDPTPATTAATEATAPAPAPAPVPSPALPLPSLADGQGRGDARGPLRLEAIAAPIAAAAAAAAEDAARAAGMDPDAGALRVTGAMLAAARAVLSHSSGIASLDNAIARGYLYVNTGAYGPALALFDVLLASFPDLLAALLAKGSACAMLGHYPDAVQCFTKALKRDPKLADAWKRRGQVQAARGGEVYLRAALADLDKALELDPGVNPGAAGGTAPGGLRARLLADADIRSQRGSVLHRLKDFKLAILEFDLFVLQEPASAVGWNYVGLCRAQLGDLDLAFGAYRHALELDPKFKEAKINEAQLLREAGDGPRSLHAFGEALTMDRGHVQTWHLRGLLHHGLGRPLDAIIDFENAVAVTGSHAASQHMIGLCLQSLGRFRSAAAALDALLLAEPGHHGWYSREMCSYYLSVLDSPLDGFNADDEMNPYFKDAMCKRHDPRKHEPLRNYTRQDLRALSRVPEVAPHGPEGDAAASLVVGRADAMGRFVLLNQCRGFLDNSRQVRQLGLASLQLAQKVRSHWASKREGGAGLQVPNASSSAQSFGGRTGAHTMGWRDALDIMVRWRQLSEPNDPVWWIDRLSPEAFTEVSRHKIHPRFSPPPPSSVCVCFFLNLNFACG